MKLTRIAPIAALGLASASLGAAAPHGSRAALLQGTWNLELLREGCDDITGERLGERWIFGADGSFERVRTRADGTASHDVGRYVVQYQETELDLVVHAPGAGLHHEAYPILTLDDTRMELLSPTQVRQGVVIQQERFAAFFHS
jgi:2-polyprenyl-6-methoxyphenol hydroxylase-like FAD-dependent oxidoreductase